MAERLDLRTLNALEHQLAEQFGPLSRFGLPVPLPAGIMAEAGKLVLALASADGELSPRERETYLSILRSYGAPDADVDALRAFVPGPMVVERVVGGQKPSFLRCLVYDAIRTARVDGFAEKERTATVRIAQRLGLETGLVTAIESLLVVEDATRRARHRLLLTPEVGSMPRELLSRIGRAVLIVAASDGELTEPEMRWFVGHMKASGAPDDLVEDFLKFDPRFAQLSDVLDERLRPFARTIVFDALRTARADGVSLRERVIAERAAEQLRLDAGLVAAMENQLEVETAVREARLHLLAPLR